MAEKDKKYYWLKLHRDFFKRHDIQIIESMPNGKDYILFYLKLLCESVDHDGNLRFSENIPYNEEMLSTISRTNVDIVRSAIKVFVELGMMEIMTDGTYYMTEVKKMLGFETYWAKKKRESRENTTQQIECNGEKLDNFQQMSNECPTCPSKSKSKRKSIELETELETELDIYQKYQNICQRLKPILPTDKKEDLTLITREIQENGLDIDEVFRKANASDFLAGKIKDFQASFDWLIIPKNAYKVLNGNYDNQKHKGKQIDERSYSQSEQARLERENYRKAIERMRGDNSGRSD